MYDLVPICSLMMLLLSLGIMISMNYDPLDKNQDMKTGMKTFYIIVSFLYLLLMYTSMPNTSLYALYSILFSFVAWLVSVSGISYTQETKSWHDKSIIVLTVGIMLVSVSGIIASKLFDNIQNVSKKAIKVASLSTRPRAFGNYRGSSMEAIQGSVPEWPAQEPPAPVAYSSSSIANPSSSIAQAAPPANANRPIIAPPANANRPIIAPPANANRPFIAPSANANVPVIAPSANANIPVIAPSANANVPVIVPPANANVPVIVPPANAIETVGNAAHPPVAYQPLPFVDQNPTAPELSNMSASHEGVNIPKPRQKFKFDAVRSRNFISPDAPNRKYLSAGMYFGDKLSPLPPSPPPLITNLPPIPQEPTYEEQIRLQNEQNFPHLMGSRVESKQGTANRRVETLTPRTRLRREIEQNPQLVRPPHLPRYQGPIKKAKPVPPKNSNTYSEQMLRNNEVFNDPNKMPTPPPRGLFGRAYDYVADRLNDLSSPRNSSSTSQPGWLF